MRHGERGYGADYSLSQRGINQVEQTAEILGSLGVGSTHPGLVLASPVPRTRETGEILATRLNIPLVECRELELWGLNGGYMHKLTLRIIDLAQRYDKHIEEDSNIIAVTHQPLIDENVRDENGDHVKAQYAKLYRLPLDEFDQNLLNDASQEFAS